MKYDCNVNRYDSGAKKEEKEKVYNIKLINNIILAVTHNQFKNLNIDEISVNNQVMYDIKSVWNKEIVDAKL